MKAIYFGDRPVKDCNGYANHIGNGMYIFTSIKGDCFMVSFMELSFIKQ